MKIFTRKGFEITIFDNSMFGFDHLLSLIDYKNLNIVKGDIRNIEDIKKSKMQDNEFIIHLAFIVGYPFGRLNPKLAEETNIR